MMEPAPREIAAHSRGVIGEAPPLDLEELFLVGPCLVHSLQRHVQEFGNRRWVRQLTAGAVSGALTKTMVAPLETVRTRLIVGRGHLTMRGVAGDILERHGWRGLWAGNGINVLRVAPSNAIELATYEGVKGMLSAARKRYHKRRRERAAAGGPDRPLGLYEAAIHHVSPAGYAGAAAGLLSSLVCYPLEVMKDRVTMDPTAHRHLGLAFSHTVRREGWGALYRGLTPTLIGMVPYSAAYYYFYDFAKRKWSRVSRRKHRHPAETLMLGGLSGVAASCLTFPLEVARKRLMVGGLAGSGRPAYKNLLDSLATIVRDDGVRGLYQGIGSSSLKCLNSSAISWTLYEGCKKALRLDQPV